MIDRISLLICFLGGGIAFLITLGIIKLTRSGKLPNGSIVIEKIESEDSTNIPGNTWTHVGVVIPPIINGILEILVIVFCIFNLWDQLQPLIAIDLPIALNWGGMIGLFLCFSWSIEVFFYNVNFTRLYKPLTGKYVLATGGPYHYVRHPGYVEAMFEFLCFFIVTGIWFVAFYSVIFLIALPFQARGEEKLLEAIFGRTYSDYAANTGQFFPKLERK